MKILITGDLVVSERYDAANINPDVLALFKQSDYNIINLEAPVTSSNKKILKTGPNIKSDKDSTLGVLNLLRIDAVTLANNHVLDYGKEGLDETLSFCKKNNIQSVGAGMNLKEASRTLFLETKVGRIAIVNFAENEWASATENTGGANPMDIIDNTNQIKDARQKADYVLVIVHGGHEYYNLPSPRMQKQYRFYADAGADLIVGHHTHCISGFEEYNGVPIYYSLGNFLFTSNSSYEDWYKGAILEVEIKKNRSVIVNLHPIKQAKDKFDISLMRGDEKKHFLNRILEYSTVINEEKSLNESWNEFLDKESCSYLRLLSPKSFIKNKYIRGVFTKLGVNFNTNYGNSLLLNLLRCEAHRDLSIGVSERYLKRKMSNFKK